MGTIQIDGESTLEDVRLWCIEHKGIFEERWKNQFRFNDQRKENEGGVQDTLKEIQDKLNHLQSRMMFVAGGAALLGSVLPLLVKGVAASVSGP
jgi:hypothetical protein